VRKFPLLLLISILFVITQQAIFSRIGLFNVFFDAVFVYIVCFAAIRNEIEGIFVALFTGILRDAFFPAVFGINTFVYILIAFLIGFVQKRIYKDSIIVPMLFTFCATFLKGIIYLSFFYIVSYKFDSSKYLLYSIPLESVYNSVISIFIYKLVQWFDTIKALKQEWKF
jgi:rod shape-determining protein MreD